MKQVTLPSILICFINSNISAYVYGIRSDNEDYDAKALSKLLLHNVKRTEILKS